MPSGRDMRVNQVLSSGCPGQARLSSVMPRNILGALPRWWPRRPGRQIATSLGDESAQAVPLQTSCPCFMWPREGCQGASLQGPLHREPALG